MIRVIPAIASHADLIKPKEIYGEVFSQRELARRAIEHAPAVSFLKGTELLAIIGYSEIFDHVGELWALTSDECLKYPVAFGRKTKEMLETFAKTHKIRRLQMVVRSGYPDEFGFALFLGFEPEGILRKYGPEGDDYYMMGKVY